jgi:Family of unknown function (DUF6882)
MTDQEFEIFLQDANDELKKKQAALSRDYALGEMKRWWFERQTAKLQFIDSHDQLAVEADVIDIGSYSPKSNSWKWAWGNASILPELRQKAEPLKRLQDITGLDLFGNANAFSVNDEAMAWELTAMAVKYIQAMGCYRAPSSSTEGPHTFLAIMGIRASNA